MREVRITMFLNDGIDEAFVLCHVRDDGTLTVDPMTTDWIDHAALGEAATVLAEKVFPLEVFEEAGD